ncbi:MAG: N-acetylmuramoyl-L-alanine amidase [Oscillospiraceae bacterium]
MSIHQNCYPDRKPSGAQVLYAASDGSEALGTQIHDNLVAYLDSAKPARRAPISEKIYLMREVKCPAVLVECGFLSNESECTKSQGRRLPDKLAAVIITSYLQYRQSLPQTGMVT